MKILTISNFFPSHPGGIEIVAKNLVTLWRKNNEVHWVACNPVPDKNEPEGDNIPLESNNFTENFLGFPYPIPSLRSYRMIIDQVNWSEIVHIHDCLYLANIIAFIAAWYLSKPVIITQHVGPVRYKEAYKNLLQHFAYQTIGRLVLRNADRVTFINEKVELWFKEKVKVERTVIIQNGVDHTIFFPPTTEEVQTTRIKLGISPNEKVLLFIGRFTHKKGLHIIRDIAIARPNYKWMILGSGEINVANWGLKNVYIFSHQPQEMLREFYIAANLFVLPSHGEGFPLTVQESMSCGVPAAVSEETAASLPDAPLICLNISSLAESLKTLDELVDNPHRLKQISIQSIEYAKQWDWDNIAGLYEKQFSDVIQ